MIENQFPSFLPPNLNLDDLNQIILNPYTVFIFAAFELFGLFTISAFIFRERSYWFDTVKNAPLLLHETVESLRDASWSERYRSSLVQALDWLDKRFGESVASHTLGVYILVAVGYAYAALFLGGGLVGVSSLAGIHFFWSEEMKLQNLGALALLSFPVMAFCFGYWVARYLYRCQRRLMTSLLRRRNKLGLRLQLFGITCWGQIFGLIWFLFILFVGQWVFGFIFLAVLLLLSTIRNRIATHNRKLFGFLESILAFVLGTVAGVVNGVVALFIVFIVYVVLSLAIVLGELTLILLPIVGTLAGLKAGAALSDLARGQHNKSHGVWVGRLGGLAGLGLFDMAIANSYIADDFATFFLVIFLNLPTLVIGFFCWLSWWATRALGRRLLNQLILEQTNCQHCSTIILYGLVDLAVAVILLVLMTNTLGFVFSAFNETVQLQQHAIVLEFYESFWLRVILLTTLLPTFSHGLMLLRCTFFKCNRTVR